MLRSQKYLSSLLGIIGLVLSVSFSIPLHAAVAPLQINTAAYNKTQHQLTVTISVSGTPSGQLTVLHSDGGILARAAASKTQTFNFPLAQLGQVPCQVEVQLGKTSVSKAVAGASAECAKVPSCKILSPATGTQLKANTDVDFKASAKLTDSKAKPLVYEWDFSGGVMGEDQIRNAINSTYKRPSDLQTKVKFVRDNSSYRVRFIATDALKRRCESAIDITVGTAPSGLPAKVGEQAAPTRGNAMPDAQKWVVIPFQEWTMQHFTDMRVLPNGYISFDPLINNINAYLFEKGSVGVDKPRFVTNDEMALHYSAAANPQDPVGANSINSTSQNWPLNADVTKASPLMKASVQKSDAWETDFRPSNSAFCKCYMSEPWIHFTGAEMWLAALPGMPLPDEGYFPHVSLERDVWLTPEDWEPYFEISEVDLQDLYESYRDRLQKQLMVENPDIKHGRYMPGIDKPYVSNDPQAMPKFDSEQQWFSATLMPITDIADDGRVNPNPLLRIEAVDTASKTVVAKTDGVLSNSRDFHCRDCHAKGKIAANPNAGYTQAAFLSSPSGMASMDMADMPTPLEKPTFYSVEDIGGNPNSLFDQEYAAALNYSSTHQFYDGMGFLDHMLTGGINENTGLAGNDWPAPCFGCHMSALQQVSSDIDWWSSESYDYNTTSYDPNYSISMHRFHAEMQYNANKTDIVRNEKGGYARFDWKNKPRIANKDINPNTLFPIFRADGKQLPMEQNCLKCHAGHREQVYNDRMKTAGVTCYDCHGDMLAVGQAYPKDAANKGSNKHQDYRIPWFDETDCGSCHVGKANVGKDNASRYFSAGVKKRAFDDNDPAANTRPVDKNDPDAVRFAIVPNYVKAFTTSATRYAPDDPDADESGVVTDNTPTQIDLPVYRFGKDQHGYVACAACHGAAHAIGPNRDPKANDNLTAIQLQGYSGQLYECNVCHTQDAFKQMDSIGSSLHYPNNEGSPTILAGPHNLHPVNDPYWWQQAEGDDVDTTPGKPNHKGIIKGGWHNDWAKLPGLNGEDQCAACHGTDHKGTRLSKVPVDRELSTETGKKITVKAGTPISCALCHTIQKSCTDSPVGKLCGTLYTTNKD